MKTTVLAVSIAALLSLSAPHAGATGSGPTNPPPSTGNYASTDSDDKNYLPTIALSMVIIGIAAYLLSSDDAAPSVTETKSDALSVAPTVSNKPLYEMEITR